MCARDIITLSVPQDMWYI